MSRGEKELGQVFRRPAEALWASADSAGYESPLEQREDHLGEWLGFTGEMQALIGIPRSENSDEGGCCAPVELCDGRRGGIVEGRDLRSEHAAEANCLTALLAERVFKELRVRLQLIDSGFFLSLKGVHACGEVVGVAFDDGKGEIRLRFEMMVDTGFSDADGGGDIVVAHSVETTGLDQALGLVEDGGAGAHLTSLPIGR